VAKLTNNPQFRTKKIVNKGFDVKK